MYMYIFAVQAICLLPVNPLGWNMELWVWTLSGESYRGHWMLLDRCKFCFGNVLKTDCLTIDSKILIHGSGFNPSQIVFSRLPMKEIFLSMMLGENLWPETVLGWLGNPYVEGRGPWPSLGQLCKIVLLFRIFKWYIYIYIYTYRYISLCDIEAPCMEYLPYLHLVNYLGSM